MYLMFIRALIITTKIWKTPKCPSTDEWIKKLWLSISISIYLYLYTVEYYSAIKKKEKRRK